MQVRERVRVDIFGAMQCPVESVAVERECGVGNQIRVEAKVSRNADRSLNRIVCDYPRYHQRRVAAFPQDPFEVRAGERAAGVLGYDELTRKRDRALLEIAPGLTRAVGRVRYARIMPHVNDGPSGLTPRREEARNIRLRLRIVPPSPTWMIDRLLDVNHDECGFRGPLPEFALH